MTALATRAVAAAYGVALSDVGFTNASQPGSAGEANRDGTRIELYRSAEDLISGRVNDEQWRARCSTLAIGDLPLSTAAAPEPKPPMPPQPPRRRRRRFRI